MALPTNIRDAAGWQAYLITIGIPQDNAETYAAKFMEQELTEAEVPDLTKEHMVELGITVMAHQMKLLRAVKLARTSHEVTSQLIHPTKTLLPCKLPSFTEEMSSTNFRTALSDWTSYKSINPLAATKAVDLLYSCCTDSVRKVIINTIPKFRELSEEAFTKQIKAIVTVHINPWTHRIKFTDMMQENNETIQQYVARLKAAAADCEYTCPKADCKFDQTEWHVKDQLIKGINNPNLQADILAKANTLTSLTDVIRHATAFESALRDQSDISDPTLTLARFTNYQRQKRFNNSRSNANRRSSNSSDPKRCGGCGSTAHGKTIQDRTENCKAWGKICGNCGKTNHFADVCRSQKAESPPMMLFML